MSHSDPAHSGENYNSTHRESSDTGSLPSTVFGSGHSSIAAKVENARRFRVAAENDVSYLQNRLSKLRNEEVKAKSDISKLRSKTDEIRAARERNEQTGSQRKDLQVLVDYSRRREAAIIALNKERLSKAVLSSKQKTMQQRVEAGVNLRKQKEINECRAQIIREEQRQYNVKQRKLIVELREKARERRQKQMDARKEYMQAIYEQRVQREEGGRIQNEKLASQLVAQEAQIVHRLRELHQKKQSSLRKLASTIDCSARKHSSSKARPSAHNEEPLEKNDTRPEQPPSVENTSNFTNHSTNHRYSRDVK